MRWLNPMSVTMRSLLVCGLMLLPACAGRNSGPKYINVSPKAPPLSAEVSAAMQPNSTELLSEAEKWLESSSSVLNSVSPK